MHTIFKMLTILFTSISIGAPMAIGAEESDPSASSPKFVIFMPEKIDVEWFWYYYTVETQHLVQTALEKTLIKKGFDVIDLASAGIFDKEGDLGKVTSQKEAIKMAKSLNATHLIVGKAEAVRMSHDVAYGVNVYRSSADVNAKVIRLSDGKVISVEEASANGGGQSQRVAGKDALKKAGKTLSKKIVAAAVKLLPSE